jgi:hypothetical protein
MNYGSHRSGIRFNTPEDALTTRKAVEQRLALIRANRALGY